jgi:hypothetical protein
MQSGRQILRRFAVRLGIQATRSAAAGAGTSVVGMAITARTEYISLRREETKQRPAMEAELHDSWGELESQIRQTLEARRQARRNALLERLNHQATQAVKTSNLPETYRILG